MSDTIQLGDIEIELTRKAVKHAHLSVHPPHGRVSLVAPAGTRLEVARAFAITKLAWIREQRSQLCAQAREAPRRFARLGLQLQSLFPNPCQLGDGEGARNLQPRSCRRHQ